ncbi:hypothetical protein AV530_011783 [Patagioenas fasciata monilis]|uniref:Uncharacterized protein n=1 Tax=Patagioenas fasciata monilis TaxID=372326 RepID=A0A1V4KLT4_PATFA|nr:hypothetical protein AV530_011783 [Patagioenas fasciata monilis]
MDGSRWSAGGRESLKVIYYQSRHLNGPRREHVHHKICETSRLSIDLLETIHKVITVHFYTQRNEEECH